MAVPAPHTIAFAIDGHLERADLPGLCEQVCGLLQRTGAAVAVCDVSAVEADVLAIEALARLQLAARRHGCQVRLRHASDELLDLLAFTGLRDVLPLERGRRKRNER